MQWLGNNSAARLHFPRLAERRWEKMTHKRSGPVARRAFYAPGFVALERGGGGAGDRIVLRRSAGEARHTSH
jgi:hypothetical protein